MNLTFKDGKFLLQYDSDGKNDIVLLDTLNPLGNKSRAPIQIIPNYSTIPNFLINLVQSYEEIAGSTEGQFAAYLLDILLTSYFIRTSAPLKVLEIGAVDGILSYHLATLMGKLNRESSLCCVSDVIGNESGNHWLDRISMVAQPPNLSMVVSDYTDTQLQSNHFDIIVINGTTWMGQPYEIIREAERMVKKSGVLVCHAKDAPLLESSFKLIFSQRQEYELSPKEHILLAEHPGTGWAEEEKLSLEEKVAELLCKLQRAVKGGSGVGELRPLIACMDECVDWAVRSHATDRKVALLELKEKTLDYMLNMEDELGEYYKAQLVLALFQLL